MVWVGPTERERMALEFCVFASGSSGNCYMIRRNETVLLLDCGIAGKLIRAGLQAHGADFCDISGVLLTHEHTDHVARVGMVGRQAKKAQIYGTAGTLGAIAPKDLPEGRTNVIRNRETMEIGGIRVTAFPVSHDAADPVAYTFSADGTKLAVLTDTGCVTEEMFGNIKDADSLVLESNYDPGMLRTNTMYPWPLKQRISGEHGHLSNDDAGSVLSRILREMNGRQHPDVLLGHLSSHNNLPAQAYHTVENELFEHRYYTGEDLKLAVAPRKERGRSPLMQVVR